MNTQLPESFTKHFNNLQSLGRDWTRSALLASAGTFEATARYLNGLADRVGEPQAAEQAESAPAADETAVEAKAPAVEETAAEAKVETKAEAKAPAKKSDKKPADAKKNGKSAVAN